MYLCIYMHVYSFIIVWGLHVCMYVYMYIHTAMQRLIENMSPGRKDHQQQVEMEEGSKVQGGVNGTSPFNYQKKLSVEGGEGGGRKQRMPPASVMTRLILIMVWRKLIRNPNTYASLLGLAWSLVSFKYVYIYIHIHIFIYLLPSINLYSYLPI